MVIELSKVGKRFQTNWIYRNLNLVFDQQNSYGIQGPNGSGKSTLLKIIATYMTPSEGQVTYRDQGQSIPEDAIYQHVSITGPYLDLIESFDLKEIFDFHKAYRQFYVSYDEWQSLFPFNKTKGKAIRYFSSGMKQRIKLLLAITTKAKVYLIDEPTTNLDDEGKRWCMDLIKRFCQDKLLIIASNEPDDFHLCSKIIDVRNL